MGHDASGGLGVYVDDLVIWYKHLTAADIEFSYQRSKTKVLSNCPFLAYEGTRECMLSPIFQMVISFIPIRKFLKSVLYLSGMKRCLHTNSNTKCKMLYKRTLPLKILTYAKK